MNWALLFMMCTRTCVPQYVELYDTKEACAKVQNSIPEPSRFSTDIRPTCIPVAKR